MALAMPMITSQGLTLIGISLSNLDDDADFQLALPFDRQPAGALDAQPDALFATDSDPVPSPAPYCSAATRACPSRCSPTSARRDYYS